MILIISKRIVIYQGLEPRTSAFNLPRYITIAKQVVIKQMSDTYVLNLLILGFLTSCLLWSGLFYHIEILARLR